MSVPRLTGSLRSFTNLSAKIERSHLLDNRYECLHRKRKHLANKKANEEGISYQSLKEAVFRLSKDSSLGFNPAILFDKLLKIVHELIGTDSSIEEIEGTANYLLIFLKDLPSVTQNDIKQLKSHFGSISDLRIRDAFDIIQKLTQLVPRNGSSNGACYDNSILFGSDIKFNSPKDFNNYDLDFIDHIEVEKKVENISFSLNTYKKRAVLTESNSKGAKCEKLVNAYDWLESELRKVHSDDFAFPIDELMQSIYTLLSSSKSNEELQAELFDFLGFDCFTLIQSILEKRSEILKVVIRKTAQAAVVSRIDKQPIIAQQVTVQLEEERLLMKQMRKEEKKMKENKNKTDDEGVSLDPVYLRNLRAASLISAQTTPVLHHTLQKANYSQPVYPNVYDSQAKAKLTSGFIAGSKMSLPVGFERINNNEYEEIIIPSCEKVKPNILGKLIAISELDSVGQLAFKGLKNLNVIQSAVFNTANNSNENMLICAPTGAGKTNIAMLTILSCIRQHMDNDVIQRDKFKVVYIAPMKALAAEMVRNFGKRLQPLGIIVKELTGDMQLTKQEIMQTQMLVTTPEKWDVVTRKSTGDVALTQIVKLLIIDEVHLLHGDRGPVLEAVVARTLRQVESTQSMIRIIGLSATLPNYIDVARFLHVNPEVGLFYFDGRFRPVPLGQTFIGVKAMQTFKQMRDMDEICYQKCLELVRDGHQVMIFVHARNATVKTALVMKELASNRGDSLLFSAEQSPAFGIANKQMSHSRNKQLRELFPSGFAVHHAGMLRSDRSLVEKYFSDGLLKVLVCTATLAWGVNLPARAVIIKGTEIYDAKRGSFVDLGILDVMQIFGRAGRPQFDDVGKGYIITHHSKLGLYLSLLTNQYPIESSFSQNLTDNLNAEVCLGTVSTIDDAVQWLRYTYLYIRMKRNPHVYGINYKDIERDPNIHTNLQDLVDGAAKALDKVQMIRYDPQTGYLNATDLGRTASHFYIKYETMELFSEFLQPFMMEPDIFAMISKSHEFEQVKVRDDELTELDQLKVMNCEYSVAGGSENTYGKVNILLQTHISRGFLDSFSLISDRNYVIQNMGRISRALFEMVLKKNWPVMAHKFLTMSKSIEKQIWPDEHPLKQFDAILGPEIIRKIEEKDLSIHKLRELESSEIGNLIHHKKMGSTVKKCAHELPLLDLEANIQPITRTVLRVHLKIVPNFSWNDRVHGTGAESFWIWVEDPENNFIYHTEYFVLQKKQVVKMEELSLVFTIPVTEPLPSQYYVKAVSDRWLESETVYPISFKHLILPERHAPHTELLDLDPLPITALDNYAFEQLYKFSHFNPIQTQLFHTVYHSDANILLGAPTGSGKTIVAELAIFRELLQRKGCKCVYIAPMKALVRERIEDWKERLYTNLQVKVVELTGDVTPDIKAIAEANIIVTTPEKWDGISRSWQTRNYVLDVSLIIIDEIHLLGEDRGPVLEVIVSRTNFIAAHTNRRIRIIGLSTAVANARDLADWLCIKKKGLYNFKPSVRPVPMQVHVRGFPGKHYCPRMATMNKPAFQAVKTHSPTKPVLIFVSSRRQTRLTALDLITYLALEENPRQWMHIPEHDMDNIISTIKDSNLKLTLAFGIGMHHAGLHERDRKTVEELFVNQKIQMLIATSTLAWGVNFPAHLVIIKGTEYFDGKTNRYVDFPVTDVLQMMGRAGRPQFDDQGIAHIFVLDTKKDFYKKFLYEPFPVESSLRGVLPDHMNAEIVSGTITTKQTAIDYITWTYFFRRLLHNPSYYDLESTDEKDLNKFLSSFVDETIKTLENSSCVEVEEDMSTLSPTVLGRIASYYYLSHKTIAMFHDKLKPDNTIEALLEVMSEAQEYHELPVRHNEDNLNGELAKSCPIEVSPYMLDNAHVKTHLLLQAHFSQLQLPIADYYTDLKSVLDQAIRIIQAMIDVTADLGWINTTIKSIMLLQMVVQGHWYYDNALMTLPGIQNYHINSLIQAKNKFPGGTSLPSLTYLAHSGSVKNFYEVIANVLRYDLQEGQIEKIYSTLSSLPIINLKMEIKNGEDSKGTCIAYNEQSQKLTNVKWIAVNSDSEYTISITLQRLNRSLQRNSTKAVTSNFSKPKDEGWILVLGSSECQELVALKKIGYVRNDRKNLHNLVFYTPVQKKRVIYTLYLFSDCYMGLDQQYDIHLDVN